MCQEYNFFVQLTNAPKARGYTLHFNFSNYKNEENITLSFYSDRDILVITICGRNGDGQAKKGTK